MLLLSTRATRQRTPEIIVVVTGKGSQKEHYLSQIKSLVDDRKLERVSIHTAWLSVADYASLLGSADLGVSLHTSSSGVDLPMKVVDMFGTGLPVVGWSKFEAWPELVQEGVNGRGFGRAAELAELLFALFKNDGAELHTLRKGALKECDKRWDSEWDRIAGRILGLVD
jgi:beta-1,4-mannosyltransferase